MPNPFEKGDIVRFAGTEDYGIVFESQKDWKEYLDKYKSDEWRKKGITLDFSDAQIVVEFLGDDGTFGHGHINPSSKPSFTTYLCPRSICFICM